MKKKTQKFVWVTKQQADSLSLSQSELVLIGRGLGMTDVEICTYKPEIRKLKEQVLELAIVLGGINDSRTAKAKRLQWRARRTRSIQDGRATDRAGSATRTRRGTGA